MLALVSAQLTPAWGFKCSGNKKHLPRRATVTRQEHVWPPAALGPSLQNNHETQVRSEWVTKVGWGGQWACCWQLAGRSQRYCWTFCQAQDSPAAKKDPAPNVQCAEADKAWRFHRGLSGDQWFNKQDHGYYFQRPCRSETKSIPWSHRQRLFLRRLWRILFWENNYKMRINQDKEGKHRDKILSCFKLCWRQLCGTINTAK